MLIITKKKKLPKLNEICNKFRVSCSLIGHVKSDKMMHVRKGENTFALLPADFVAHAPLLDRKKTMPKYLRSLKKENKNKKLLDYSKIILKLL